MSSLTHNPTPTSGALTFNPTPATLTTSPTAYPSSKTEYTTESSSWSSTDTAVLVSVTITVCLFLLLVYYFYSTIYEYTSGVFTPRTAEDKQRLITEASGTAQIAELYNESNLEEHSNNETLLSEISRSIEDSVWHEDANKKITMYSKKAGSSNPMV